MCSTCTFCLGSSNGPALSNVNLYVIYLSLKLLFADQAMFWVLLENEEGWRPTILSGRKSAGNEYVCSVRNFFFQFTYKFKINMGIQKYLPKNF